MKGEHIKYVKVRLDPANPPKWSAEERARLNAIADKDIDTTDESPVTDFSGFKRHSETRKHPTGNINGATTRKPVAG